MCKKLHMHNRNRYHSLCVCIYECIHVCMPYHHLHVQETTHASSKSITVFVYVSMNVYMCVCIIIIYMFRKRHIPY